MRAIAYGLFISCLFLIASVYYLNSVVVEQRDLIRVMSTNPSCMGFK